MINTVLISMLFITGVFGLILSKNLVKKVMALNIINSAIVILFVNSGSAIGSHAPIIFEGETDIVDHVPQALMLTAIVVGICVTALALSLVYRLSNVYSSLDITEIEKKAGYDK